MFHGTLSDMKETLIPISFTHSNDNLCLSCIGNYQGIKFAKFYFFKFIILFQNKKIVEGFTFSILLSHVSTFYYTYLRKPRSWLEIIRKLLFHS